MKKFFLFYIFFAVFFHLHSQNGIYEMVSTGINEPIGFKELDANSSILVSNKSNSNPKEISIIKTNKQSQPIWAKNIKLSPTLHSVASDFIVDDDGNIVIIGQIQTSSCFVLKLNGTSGDVIFSKTASLKSTSASNRYYRIYQMKNNSNEDYIILGTINQPYTHCITRINKLGNSIWAKEYDAIDGDELAYGISEAQNGEIIISCNFRTSGNFDHGFIHINPNDGTIIYAHQFDLNYSNAFNGGIDHSTSVEGTNWIAGTFHINGGSAVRRQGLLLYNTSNKMIEHVKLYDVSSKEARSLSVSFDKKSSKLYIGGGFHENIGENAFIQIVELNNISNCKSYKLKNIDYNTKLSGYLYNSVNSNSNILFSCFIKDKNTTTTSARIVTGSQTLNYFECLEELNTSSINVNIPNPVLTTINLISNYNHQDFTPQLTNQNFVVKDICASKCIATEKLFRLKTIKRIDTICYQQNSYNLNIQVTDNQKDTLIKVIAYRKNANVFIPNDSQEQKLNFVFNLPTNFNFINEWMFIGKTNCSFNDTVFFTLQKHFLNTSLTINDTLFCQNENVEIQSFWSQLKKIPINFNWYDNNTNRLLSNQDNLTFKATENQSIRLEIDDNCAEKNILYTKYQVAPLISDSTIILNKKACQPLKTAFIHPKTIPINISNTNFKWKWSIDGLNVDSTNSKGGQLEQNKNYTFENAGQFILKAEMVLDNNKICQSYTDSVWVLEKALSDFNFNPKVADLTDSIIKFENVSKYASNYRWTISDGNIYLTHSPKHQFPGIGSYNVQLIAYNDANCNDTIEKTYTIYGNYTCFLPNAFSPNGSGINDLWKPYIHAAQSIELLIFNRWGEQIFLSNDINCTWDGSYKNNICQEGIYVYLLKVKSVKGKFFYYKGTIELLR